MGHKYLRVEILLHFFLWVTELYIFYLLVHPVLSETKTNYHENEHFCHNSSLILEWLIIIDLLKNIIKN